MVELARRAAPLRWALVSLSLASSHAADPAPAKPNLLWIVMDDVGVELPCYGEKSIQTPNIDRLVREGTRFERAFLTSSVCSPSRSAMITGMYQTTIGAHHHRSGRGTEKIHLPAGVEPVPAILQRAGYQTSNGDYPAKGKRVGKTDYNFEWDPGIYDEGIRTPFIVRGPGIPRGAVRGDLIEHIDMAATTLAWAGLPVPPWMQGRDLFARDYKPRDAVFAARDRCGETVDRIRSVRTERFKYIRNFHPLRPLLQPNDYKDSKPFLPVLRDLHAQGKLSPLQEEILFSPTRPAEELYEVRADPFETRNLAGDPEFQSTLETLRARLDRWMVETRDRGPESEHAYDANLAYELGTPAGKARNEALLKNSGLMKQWAKEGK
jgi:arylsulfatase A-like enzyme